MKKMFNTKNQNNLNAKYFIHTSIVVLILLSYNGYCTHLSNYKLLNEYTNQLPIKNDSNLSLEIVSDNSKRILRVSFNGEEGNEGTLKIYNLSGDLVKESNFELIKSPFYASVDITELVKGNYKVELTTNKSIHNSNIEIK